LPLDPRSGVHYSLHGQGQPLMIGLPLMASFTAIFGDALEPVLKGYLEPLTSRYRVLLVDYPSIGGSVDIAPEALTADRVCADLLSVATAAGFERFAYWGYSWSGAVGLQLAHRTDRLDALVIGGWPPLDGPYAAILEATQRKQAEPEASSLKILRSKDQYRQWQHYYESMLGWDEAASVARINCPKLLMFGAEGDLVEAGVPVPIASLCRQHRSELQAQGWQVHEIAGQGHGVCIVPDLVVPPVLAFLDRTFV
jgi:pimeloyl-ACP methyl ester carboxylesterase